MIWPIPNFMAWTALAVGLAVGAGVQQIRVNNAKTELAQVREQHAQAVADAALAKAAAHARALEIERELTAREQALQATIDKQDQDARHAQAKHAADRAAATAAADRLRIALDTIRHSRRDAPSAAAPIAGQCAADRLAKLLAGADDLAGRSSEAADNAIRRGLMCEAAYDAARQALIDARR